MKNLDSIFDPCRLRVTSFRNGATWVGHIWNLKPISEAPIFDSMIGHVGYCLYMVEFGLLVSEKVGLTEPLKERAGKFVQSSSTPCIEGFCWKFLGWWLKPTTTGVTYGLKWQCSANCPYYELFMAIKLKECLIKMHFSWLIWNL